MTTPTPSHADADRDLHGCPDCGERDPDDCGHPLLRARCDNLAAALAAMVKAFKRRKPIPQRDANALLARCEAALDVRVRRPDRCAECGDAGVVQALDEEGVHYPPCPQCSRSTRTTTSNEEERDG